MPAPPTASSAGEPGQVEYVSYSPKLIKLRAKAAAPSVLLLNDKYDPAWKVSVDGKPEKVLRANFIVRGVYLPAGEHLVEFRFAPPLTGLYVTLTAMAAGVFLCGFLIVAKRRAQAPVPASGVSDSQSASEIDKTPKPAKATKPAVKSK